MPQRIVAIANGRPGPARAAVVLLLTCTGLTLLAAGRGCGDNPAFTSSPAAGEARPATGGAPRQTDEAPGPGAPAQPAFAADFAAQVEAAALAGSSAYPSAIAVAVRRTSDGAAVRIGGDVVFYAASTFKLAVLYAAERRISEGALSLDDRLALTAADYAEDLGTAGELAADEAGTLSVGDALWAMIVHSDNTTAVAFLHLLGTAAIDGYLREAGARVMSVQTTDLPTTADDLAAVMTALVTGLGLTTDAVTHARDLLTQQATRNGIPAGLPEGVSVGNKTGTWPGALHDVAFIEAGGDLYIVAILTDGTYGWAAIAAVAAAVYGAISG